MVKFSIIVPVYNTRKYIEECLLSLKNQNENNFEVLMIDDGSTDSSALFCKKIAKSDNRFKYFYKENGGVSSARNFGIDKSIGKYILFVDSDDFVLHNYLNCIEKEIKDNDLLCFNFYDLYTNKTIIHSISEKIDNDIISNILLSNNIGGFLFNKVFNADIIKKNNIKFNEKIHFCEDLLFVSDYIDFCSKYKYVSLPLYYYRIRKSSVSNNFISKKNSSILDAYEILLNKYDDSKSRSYYSYMYYYYYYLFRKYYPIKLICSKNLKKQRSIKLFLLRFFSKTFLKLKKIKSPKNVFE